MRSHTLDSLPGRCKRCWIREEYCLCPYIPELHPRTELVLVRHQREAWKSTGTARIAALALPELKLVEYGDDSAPAGRELSPLLEGAALLFPPEEGSAVASAPVKRLIVLDGTWRQARRMVKKLPGLAALPRLTLPLKEEKVLRLRTSPRDDDRSTLEAIADALQVLEGDELGEPLHRLHALMVERVFRARGVWDLKSQGVKS
jgi:DTW domain-containing protein YfiP